MSDEPETDDDIITCWCGARGQYEQLFDDRDADGGCGGTGTIQCTCGGDQCVCHHHGEYECPGCDECEAHAWDWDGDIDDGHHEYMFEGE